MRPSWPVGALATSRDRLSALLALGLVGLFAGCAEPRSRDVTMSAIETVQANDAGTAHAPPSLVPSGGDAPIDVRITFRSRVARATRSYVHFDRGWKRITVRDGSRTMRSGLSVPLDARAVATGPSIVPLALGPHESRTWLVRFEADRGGWEPPREFVDEVDDVEAFSLARQHARMALGVYAGLLLALAFVSLLFAGALRERLFVDYVLYSVPYGMMWIARDYILAESFWPSAPYVDDFLLFAFVCASIVLGNRFAMRFLATRELLPRIHRLLTAVNALVTGLFVLGCAGFFRFVPELLGSAALATSVLYLLSGAILASRGLRQGRLFFFATASVAVGTIVYTLWDFGLLPTSPFTTLSAQIGSAVEMTILAFALTERVRRVDEERHAAEVRLRGGLEREVEERTAELERINDKLIELNQQLELQSMTDALTGVANRRRFESALDDEWRRATRERGPLSLLIVDVDHFKRFNDTHGHSAGDACLREIAAVLGRGTRRVGDLIARYGGEEFVLILANTPRDAAEAHAERLRAAVEATDVGLPEGARVARVTVSIGVATVASPATDGSTTAALFARADEALYRAKDEGRNRVCVAE